MVPLIAQAKPEEIERIVSLIDLSGVFYALLIVVLAWVVNRAMAKTVESLGAGHAKRRLRLQQVLSFLRIALFAITAYLVVLAVLGENDRALLGLGTTLAVAIGFALKDTASSIMAGVLILIDRPFRVGDRVTFEGTYGDVVEIGLRSVRIQTLSDDLISIPNNKFLTESIASGNAGELHMMVVMDFLIAAPEDFELAKRIVYEACVASKYTYLRKGVSVQVHEAPTEVGLATKIKVKAYIIDVKYEGPYKSDVTERVKRAFRHYEIRYPYMREFSVRYDEWVEPPSRRPEQYNRPKRHHEIAPPLED